MLYKTRYRRFYGFRIYNSIYVCSKQYIPVCIEHIRLLSIEIDRLSEEIDRLFTVIYGFNFQFLSATLNRLCEIRKTKQESMKNYHDSIRNELQNIQNVFAQN